MATTLSNGVVIPDPADLIPGNGVQAFRDQGASVNSALGQRALTTHTHSWGQIEGKPTTFTPASHTHVWTDLADPPATFPPAAHTHAQSDVSGLTARLDAIEAAAETTGLRNISSLFPEVVFSGGQSTVTLSRTGRLVQVSMYGIRFESAASFNHFSTFLPAGFRPLPGTLLIVPIIQGTTSTIRLRVTSAGQMTVYDHDASSLLYGSVTFATANAWPSTLPGIPA